MQKDCDGGMRPGYHLLSAVVGGYPYYHVSGSVESTLWFAASTVMMDMDHVADYILWNKRPLSIRRFFERGSLLQGSRMVFILHGYECVLLCYALAWWSGAPALLAVSNGFLLHLLLDEIGNRLFSGGHHINAFFYFLAYRWLKGFRVEKISSMNTVGMR